ncbi:MAG: YhfC family intramembrane metalloprotease [Ardenticatenales bacterium]|nr:YhfC family intramembrane metalloprotease [Ardenticatenales bacterium]
MIHFLFLLLNALIMMALPFVLGHFLSQRLRFDWGLFGVGAITFILSQVGHIPFNQFVFARVPALSANLILLALFGGLSAGVFEEVARYLMYRFWVRDARDGPSALILGLGHGGIESFLLGLLVGINGYFLFLVHQGGTTVLVPEAQMPALQQATATLLQSPPYLLLLGAIERLFAIALHISLSLIVLQTFTRRQGRWLLLAIGLHALFDAAAVYAATTWSAIVAELIIGLMAALLLAFAWRLRHTGPAPAAEEPLPNLSPAPIRPVELSADRLDDSRYQ